MMEVTTVVEKEVVMITMMMSVMMIYPHKSLLRRTS